MHLIYARDSKTINCVIPYLLFFSCFVYIQVINSVLKVNLCLLLIIKAISKQNHYKLISYQKNRSMPYFFGQFWFPDISLNHCSTYIPFRLLLLSFGWFGGLFSRYISDWVPWTNRVIAYKETLGRHVYFLSPAFPLEPSLRHARTETRMETIGLLLFSFFISLLSFLPLSIVCKRWS